MKRSLIKRNKKILSKCLKIAKSNDMLLDSWLVLMRRYQEAKASQGTFLKWSAYEAIDSSSGITVPVCLIRTGEIISHQWFIDKAMLPENKKHLWTKNIAE